MTLLISSALKPSLLVFSCNKQHEIVKEHSFRKGCIRLLKCVYSSTLHRIYAKQTTRNKPPVYCLRCIWRNFSRGIDISNDPLKCSDNDLLTGKQFIILCVVKSVWCIENNNCHFGRWMQCHFQANVTVLRNNLIIFILVEAVGVGRVA
jgi:hypothetical protein